jgi:hypothetical protein
MMLAGQAARYWDLSETAIYRQLHRLLCSFEAYMKITLHFHVFTLVKIGHEDPVPNCANRRARECGITGNS